MPRCRHHAGHCRHPRGSPHCRSGPRCRHCHGCCAFAARHVIIVSVGSKKHERIETVTVTKHSHGQLWTVADKLNEINKNMDKICAD